MNFNLNVFSIMLDRINIAKQYLLWAKFIGPRTISMRLPTGSVRMSPHDPIGSGAPPAVCCIDQSCSNLLGSVVRIMASPFQRLLLSTHRHMRVPYVDT